jgi:hypothetical protein
VLIVPPPATEGGRYQTGIPVQKMLKPQILIN